MSNDANASTRAIRDFSVQATTERLPEPPGKVEAVLLVRDAQGNQTDKQRFHNTSDPFQGHDDALEAAQDFLQRIDVTDEGKLIAP
ncbi:hypothetical protein L2249_16370 [Xanthomonas perforans]|uniref:hypothetical protein n=1 Tax=Xanthomonas perforans TaxID=442694 RepID=UPI000B19AD0B|nr:hypothetical protein [Xanthomonas perforans]MBZ2583297.1 hypothetical protein [Xanthomonas perforans]MBZ2596452.1 hypothetical protein [Xanthomonas perforans]MBZ2609429.1 hypothetical protein [Xanthomonas perforans]MBZ2622452.1 hypothetical protein [Xanthomonas perforans]MBZ2635591.1 hypothetical protein [Xanthomonas perforans]